MKQLTRLTALLLALMMLSFTLCLTSCYQNDAEDIIGRWRMISYITDDGLEAPIDDHELDMIFYSTGVGEATADGKTQYMFDYTLKNGKLNRLITRSDNNVSEVSEPYTFSKDRSLLTIYSPDDAATIVLQKIEDQVLDRIEINR